MFGFLYMTKTNMKGRKRLIIILIALMIIPMILYMIMQSMV